ALEMYLRIKEAYGWDAFKKTFRRYREPGFQHPRSDAQKWDVFARELSKTTGHDMGAALAAWSIPLSEEARAFCAAFPPPDPRITRGLVKKPYAPPPAEPVEGDYMGIALTGEEAGNIALYRTATEVPGGPTDKRWKTTHLLLRRVGATGGPFVIGNRDAPKGWDGPREIEITKPYYFGVYEVTQEQWFHVMGSWKDNCFGAAGDRKTRPVNAVSYNQTRGAKENGINWPQTGHAVAADSFIGRLRALIAYRAEIDLPTEAQWEYAARAGTTGRWNNGAEPQPYKGKRSKCDKVLDTLGRYCANGGEPDDGGKVERGVATEYGTAAVGSYAPNAWGIYDTHGNVYEHCLDWWMAAGPDQGQTGADPVGPASSGEKDRRVMRGGSWWNFLYGDANACANWGRDLSRLIAPGTAHEAAGFRLCVPAAIARDPQPGPDDEPLSPAAYEARKQLLAGVTAIGSAGLPGPVYCLSSNAFPVVAARCWDGEPAAMAAAAFCGKGRIVLVADDRLDTSLADNARFRENALKWLSQDGRATIRELNLDDVEGLPNATWPTWLDDGDGVLLCGRAWPWRQYAAMTEGKARVSDWPWNHFLSRYGLAVGDFCVSQTVAGGFTTRLAPAEGCAAAPSSFFEEKMYPKPTPPVPAPLRDASKGPIVRDGETIAFLGDSITRLGAKPGAYIDLVIQGLEKAGVKNVGRHPAGIDGNHAGDMLGRVGTILSDPSVRIMTVSCGVNDVWGFDWGRGQMLEEYKENVRAIYDKAARAGVLVVAVTPTLIGEDPSAEKNRVLDQFANFIREEAKARGLPLADPRADEIEALAKFPPDSGLHFTYDGVHPVQTGNELIARSILRALGVFQEGTK
ncbi:MAG: SUMF1/EgtB/PvdO family nonheme iron enzyme, partial [Kiritimatiellae bacterium]|nr:SUMF1/EgtB/PvdO family nonheme iron enzyme [Kiritimatiellia bacterium]